nr:random slug protein 5-like [Ipomoea batatas]
MSSIFSLEQPRKQPVSYKPVTLKRLGLAILYKPHPSSSSPSGRCEAILERKDAQEAHESRRQEDGGVIKSGAPLGRPIKSPEPAPEPRMKEDDKKMVEFIKSGAPLPSDQNVQNQPEPVSPESPSGGLYDDDDSSSSNEEDDDNSQAASTTYASIRRNYIKTI